MASDSQEIVFEFIPFIRVFKDGNVHRFLETNFIPPSQDPTTKVLSKDILISPENNVSVRIFLPNNHDNQKLPLLIYFHGGGFCIESAFSTFYHTYLTNLVAEANVVAVSVDYRLAPEHPITACYEDSWSALKWVVANAESEPWLRDYADLSRIFLGGDSAGANLAHDMMVRASDAHHPLPNGVNLVGMALIHPYFGNDEPDKLWNFISKEDSKLDDPRFNPAVHPKLLEKLVCKKILICTAEKDFLKQRGFSYYEAIKNTKWNGDVEIMDTQGEDHVFHLRNPECDNAITLLQKVSAFLQYQYTSGNRNICKLHNMVADLEYFFKVYKDGLVERYLEADFVPPSEDSQTGVITKDVKIPPENNVVARLYLPKNAIGKVPVLVYIHGGAFCLESAFSSFYHPYLNRLVSEANVVAVSIEYRLAPEFPIPVCYDDCWSVLKWIENSFDSEPWLRDHADFSRTFLAGDSAGANISHEMMVRASNESRTGVNLKGVVLIHPFFGHELFDDVWLYIGKESNIGLDDPRLNPTVDEGNLSKIVCKKILICTAGLDILRDCGWSYYEAMKKSGWGGEVEIVETKGEDHVFHLKNPASENAHILMKKMASFFT